MLLPVLRDEVLNVPCSGPPSAALREQLFPVMERGKGHFLPQTASGGSTGLAERHGHCSVRSAARCVPCPRLLGSFLPGRSLPRLQIPCQISLSVWPTDFLPLIALPSERLGAWCDSMSLPGLCVGEQRGAPSSAARRKLGSKIKKQKNLTCK